MNRRRNEVHSSGFPIFALVIGFAIMAAGGVLHGYYKNSQVKISREIDAIDRRIEQDRLDIRTTEMRMDQLLNRFVIRKQLQANGSAMRPIPLAAIEEIDLTPAARRAVAAASP